MAKVRGEGERGKGERELTVVRGKGVQLLSIGVLGCERKAASVPVRGRVRPGTSYRNGSPGLAGKDTQGCAAKVAGKGHDSG